MIIGKIKSLSYKLLNILMLGKKNICFDKTLKINGKLLVFGTGNIIIGKNVTINSGYLANPSGGLPNTILYTEYNGQIVIGDNVGLSNCAICSFEKIEIEDNVMIGTGVRIYDTDFHCTNYIERLENKSGNIPVEAVKICEGVFIGAGSIVLKGVTLGRHSVVGAGSVVTKSIPDDEIWAGNPARFVRKISE